MPVIAWPTWRPWVAAVLLSLPAVPSARAGATDRLEPDPKQRQAVRGIPVDDDAAETPELREMRRFEERTFSRQFGLPIPIIEPEQSGDDIRRTLPPGLRGEWSGSGDVPPVLRLPDAHGRQADVDDKDARPAWLSGLKMPELPVRWDARVLRYLDYFKNDERGRAIMSSWIRRSGRYRVAFERIMVEQGLPRDLIFLAMIESGFAPAATSNVGAGGVWQFMTGAARAYGLEVGHWVDARRDPERAAEAAAHYLKDLYIRFGSWHLAFAAYNAGYGAVLQSIARYNTNDFWELGRHEAGLPWETTLYVPKILAAAIVGHNIEAFGYHGVVMDPPLAYDQVVVPAGTTLASIARAARVGIEDIEGLNPELIRGRTPPDRDAQPVRIPAGSGDGFVQAFAKARTAADAVQAVVLRYGETLEDVAKRHGVSIRELRRLNGVSSSRDVRGGTTIVVPDSRAAERSVGASGGATTQDEKLAQASAADSDSDADQDLTLVALPDKQFGYPGYERVFYRTRMGDTLSELSGVFGASIANLMEWNNLDPDAKLQAGMVMQVFVSKDFDRAEVALLDPAHLKVVTLGSDEFLELQAAVRGKTRLHYQAKSGDTLAKIARRYGLSPGDLARINRFSFNTELTEGQKIVVYSPSPELPHDRMGRRPPPTPPSTRAGAAAPLPGRADRGARSEVKAAADKRVGKTGRPPEKDAASNKGAPKTGAAGDKAKPRTEAEHPNAPGDPVVIAAVTPPAAAESSMGETAASGLGAVAPSVVEASAVGADTLAVEAVEPPSFSARVVGSDRERP